MATLKPILPDALTQKLTRLGNQTDKICETALKAGAAVAKSAVDNQLKTAVGTGTKYPSRATGELERSLGVTPVRVDAKGNYDIKIGFAEPREDGNVNAKIANILEYGKHGQPAKAFLKKAKSKSKAETMAVIAATLETEMNNV